MMSSASVACRVPDGPRLKPPVSPFHRGKNWRWLHPAVAGGAQETPAPPAERRPEGLRDEGLHAAHDLRAGGPAIANLVERQGEEDVPGRVRNEQADRPVAAAMGTDLQLPPAQATQQILDLIERRTAVVGSFTAGESALMAMSTSSRIAYLGSCSKVRSAPVAKAPRSRRSPGAHPAADRSPR